MIQVPRGVDESWFNAQMRSVLRAQGLQCAHIRETDAPGFSDLLVWSGSEIVAFVELKIDGKPLETSQVEFLRAQDAATGSAYVLDLHRRTGIIIPMRGRGSWVELVRAGDELVTFDTPWKKWFWDHKREDNRYR